MTVMVVKTRIFFIEFTTHVIKIIECTMTHHLVVSIVAASQDILFEIDDAFVLLEFIALTSAAILISIMHTVQILFILIRFAGGFVLQRYC